MAEKRATLSPEVSVHWLDPRAGLKDASGSSLSVCLTFLLSMMKGHGGWRVEWEGWWVAAWGGGTTALSPEGPSESSGTLRGYEG